MCPAEAAGHILVLNPALVRGVKDHRAGESPLSRPFRALSISLGGFYWSVSCRQCRVSRAVGVVPWVLCSQCRLVVVVPWVLCWLVLF